MLKLIFFILAFPLLGQDLIGEEVDGFDEKFKIGGDIFSDFQEEVESSQILEDERFYRFGRFFSVNLGLGLTSFMNNRGNAYEDKVPSFLLSINYFFDFTSSFVFGLEFSSHEMNINFHTILKDDENIGNVSTRFLRPFIGYRYYFNTDNLNTVFTHSNPYFTTRIEYWYQTNEFNDSPEIADIRKTSGGGFGAGLGFGIEIPLVVKKRYLGVESLFHPVSLFDSNTNDYQGPQAGDIGFANLKGPAFSIFVSLNETW